MNQNEILSLLSSVNAMVADSHIVYTSGKHGSSYVNKDALYPHTNFTSMLCKEIATHFANHPIDTVVAPAIGGVILSQWLAHHLTGIQKKKIFSVYAEKNNDSFIIKRGYDQYVRNMNILVVEDIVTTGGSVKKVIEEIKKLNGHIIGAACLCNRGGINASDLGNIPELFSLLSLSLESWEESICPLCKKGVPINTQVGKGLEYLTRKKQG